MMCRSRIPLDGRYLRVPPVSITKAASRIGLGDRLRDGCARTARYGWTRVTVLYSQV